MTVLSVLRENKNFYNAKDKAARNITQRIARDKIRNSYFTEIPFQLSQDQLNFLTNLLEKIFNEPNFPLESSEVEDLENFLIKLNKDIDENTIINRELQTQIAKLLVPLTNHVLKSLREHSNKRSKIANEIFNILQKCLIKKNQILGLILLLFIRDDKELINYDALHDKRFKDKTLIEQMILYKEVLDSLYYKTKDLMNIENQLKTITPILMNQANILNIINCVLIIVKTGAFADEESAYYRILWSLTTNLDENKLNLEHLSRLSFQILQNEERRIIEMAKILFFCVNNERRNDEVQKIKVSSIEILETVTGVFKLSVKILLWAMKIKYSNYEIKDDINGSNYADLDQNNRILKNSNLVPIFKPLTVSEMLKNFDNVRNSMKP